MIATTRPPVVYAAGAYAVQNGARLRCGLLIVKAGNKHKIVTLRDFETKARIRVKLPKEALNAKGHAKFTRIELEVLP